MLSKPYFVNFKFRLSNLDYNLNNLSIRHNDQLIPFQDNIELKCNKELIAFSIISLNTKIYKDKKSYIENFSEILDIVVDNFWIFKTPYIWNTVRYDNKYIDHVKKYGQGWEVENLQNCQSLHFNGELKFEFLCPIARNFNQ